MVELSRSSRRVADDLRNGALMAVPFGVGFSLLNIAHQKAGSPTPQKDVVYFLKKIFQEYKHDFPVNRTLVCSAAIFGSLVPIMFLFTTSIINEIWISNTNERRSCQWFKMTPTAREKRRKFKYLLANCVFAVLTAMVILKMAIPTRYLLADYKKAVYVLTIAHWKLLVINIAGLFIK